MQTGAIAGRLYKSFLVVTIVMGLAATALFFGIYRYTGHRLKLDGLRDKARVGTIHFKIQVQEWKNILIRGHDPAKFQQYKAGFDAAAAKVDQQLAEIELATDPEIVRIAQSLRQNLTQLNRSYNQALAESDLSEAGATRKIDNIVRGKDRGPTEEFEQLARAIEVHLAAESRRDTVILGSAAVLIGGLSLILSWGILILTVRHVKSAIDSAANGIRRSSDENDLSLRLQPNAREFSPLVAGFNNLIGKLEGIVRRLSQDSANLTGTAAELNRAAEELSAGAQNQASATEEMAASVEEVSGGAESIAQNASSQAQHLTKLAEQSHENSVQGTATQQSVQALSERTAETARDAQEAEASLASMNTAMREIADSASIILEIVSSLSEISDQVDLLALNAAIEAARAGEAGRGFAVVAQSIGELAGKTSQRLANINDHAQANANEVGRGIERVGTLTSVTERIIKRVNDMTKELQSIASQIGHQVDAANSMDRATRDVKRLASEISTAASEQLAALNELGRTTGNLAQQTQEQAAAAEQVAGAAVRLKGLSSNMQQSASEFRTSAVSPGLN
ncbi:MAG: methyl-accepting chemotaxis protein [Leptospirales bacterium]|nr:methyl-accepting chemotaxis protein [Leptospirales bacterium]